MRIRNNTAKEISVEFDSLHELLSTAEKGPEYITDTSWAGGFARETARKIREGCATSNKDMEKARGIMDAVDTSFRDREVNQWMPSIAGAYPVVPDYLIGMPESMRERRPVESDHAPIKMFVEVSYSAGVSADAISQRGTALAALLMRMAEERPVELHLFVGWALKYNSGRRMIWSVKLDTNPISLQQVMDTIACKGFCRAINFNACNALNKDLQQEACQRNEPFYWAFSGDYRKEKLREHFQLEEKDILIERGYLDDESLMKTDPVEWVHRQLEKQRALDDN